MNTEHTANGVTITKNEDYHNFYGCMAFLVDNRLIDGSKVVSPMHQPHFTPQKQYYFNISGTHFC
jgi:hypothetical protein